MMNEKEFYRMLDVVEAFNDVTDGYYPTVKELEAHRVAENLTKHLPFVAYFATDPLRRSGDKAADFKDYKDTVRYCKELVNSVEVVPENAPEK